MALVDRIEPTSREVPHEPGNTFSFRQLTALQFDEVRKSGLLQLMEVARGAQEFSSLIEAARKNADPLELAVAEALPKQAQVDLASLDKTLLVRYGVTAWQGPNYDGVACDGAARDQLDEKTRDWAAGVVAEISDITQGEAERSETGTGSPASSPSTESRKVSEPSGTPS